MDECGYVTINLYLQKQTACQIRPVGYSLLTPSLDLELALASLSPRQKGIQSYCQRDLHTGREIIASHF